jgi:putative transposase
MAKAKRIRIHRPDMIYMVSNRCVDELFLMRPDARVNALVLGCLARAVEKHGVELIGFVFMANHFHLVLRAPNNNLSAFMQDFERWLAIKLQRGNRSPAPLLTGSAS